jgi:hypothetical protein
MRFGITMDNLNIDNVQLDLDTLLRFVCAYALNDTHVSQTIIASSFESLPDQIKSLVCWLNSPLKNLTYLALILLRLVLR